MSARTHTHTQKKGHGKAVDWWTLGVLTYELLAGRPPWYDAHDQANTYKLILGGELALPAGWSPLAKDFVGRLLQVFVGCCGCGGGAILIDILAAHTNTTLPQNKKNHQNKKSAT